MPRALRLAASLVLPLAFAACGSGGSSSSTTGGTTSGGGAASGQDPYDFATAPASCVYDCGDDACAERKEGSYLCPSLGAWEAIPHVDACPSWDGSFPAPATGQCSATLPKGDALKYAGVDPDDPKTRVMPGGRRLTPAGAVFEFSDPKSMTTYVIAVPGTSFVLTVDTGYGDHLVRVVDAEAIGEKDPVLSQVNFPDPESLNQGIAFSPPNRVYVATAGGKVQALSLDLATGKLARDDARSLALPEGVGPKGSTTLYVSGVSVSADGTRLFATTVDDEKLFVLDISEGAPSYGALLGQADLGDVESYAVFTDPHDPSTRFVYVTMWSGATVKEVDVLDPAAPVVSRSFSVGKNPQGLAFLDGRWMVVGNDLGDTLSLIDRVEGTVTSLPIEAELAPKGLEPSSLAFDESSKRLYATLAGLNAVSAFDVDLSKDPPQIIPAGRLPTLWWPSGSVVRPDGSLVVISMLGSGVGPRKPEEEYELLHGGIQHIPAPSPASLAAGEALVAANDAVTARSGYPTVDCPAGAEDFPIPPTNTASPSPAIEHVIFIVRENKTYDGLFGDLPGGKGDAQGTMVPKEEMDGIWRNLRTLAKTFSFSDNFYTSAFISTQGHLWTTHGRTDDFNEREWPVTGYGRGLRSDADSGGVIEVGRPEQGSVFDWLQGSGVRYDVLGEIVGSPSKLPVDYAPIDGKYPGGPFQNITYNDLEKACHTAGRLRVACDLSTPSST
jgi:DNA-binding beta-propeller fold protein YncE